MKRFKHTERTTKIFNLIIKAYREIESDSDLKKYGLTYDDYKSNELGLILDGLRFYGEIETDNERIVKWLSSYGCNVYMISDRWKIEL